MRSSSEFKIMLEVDRDDAFDYENSSNAKYSVNDLKEILAREIKDIRLELNNWNLSNLD